MLVWSDFWVATKVGTFDNTSWYKKWSNSYTLLLWYLGWRRSVLIIRAGRRASFAPSACGTGGFWRGGGGSGGLRLLLWVFRVIHQLVLQLRACIFTQRVVLIQILLITTALWGQTVTLVHTVEILYKVWCSSWFNLHIFNINNWDAHFDAVMVELNSAHVLNLNGNDIYSDQMFHQIVHFTF